MRKTRSQTQAENAARNDKIADVHHQQNQLPSSTSGTIQQVAQMDIDIDRTEHMLSYFRVYELKNLLSAFNVPNLGKKSDLLQRAHELLKANFLEVDNKIKEIDRKSNTRENKASPSELGAPDSKRAMYQPQIQLPVQPDCRAVTLSGNNIVGGNLVVPFASSVTHGYPIHPDVRLKKLAFYDVITTLLRPSTLVPTSNQRLQEATFFFTLTPQQATEIAINRDIRNGSKVEHTIQVQLRFCLLETSCEQEDCFPSNIVLKVNNKLCSLPNPIPTNRPNVEPKRPPRPVNVTSNVKLSPTVTNSITVQWCPDFTRCFVVSAYLVRKLTSQQLLTRMKAKGIKSADHTRALIKDKLKEDADCEIATTMLKVSLMCPLGKMRMSVPCRASTCSHLQCFDASLYLQMNERKPTWHCPVCDKPAVYDTLTIDGYFQEVLASPLLTTNDNEIQLHKDGSWSSPMMTVNETQVVDTPKSKQKVEVISDDLEVITTEVEQKANEKTGTGISGITNPLVPVPLAGSVAANNEPTSTTNNETVDLTLSDSDDDLPLRRKVVHTSSSKINTSISTTTCTLDLSQAKGSSVVSTVTVCQKSDGDDFIPTIISLDSPSPPSSPNKLAGKRAVTSSTTTPICPLPSNPTQSGSHTPKLHINPLAVTRFM